MLDSVSADVLRHRFAPIFIMMLIRLGNGDGGEQSMARVGSFYTVNNDYGPRSRMHIVDGRAELDNRHCGGTVAGEGPSDKVTYNYTPLFRGRGGRGH